MKKIFIMLAVAASIVSCGNNKPEKTIENLKAAITGESNASAKYAAFAQKAEADSLFNVAAIFRATSQAEANHAANHLKVLSELGVEFTPVVEEVAVATTLENLATAKQGEDYELTTMYPEFITVAQTEKAEKAAKSFNWAMTAEGKHSNFYNAAIEAINTNGNDTIVANEWVVCPICGDTYAKSEVGTSCALCGTSSEQFAVFTATAPVVSEASAAE